MKLYPDTEKELFFETDYVKLPVSLRGISLASLRELLENLENAQENAWLYGAELLQIALDMDIRKVEMYIRIAEKREKSC